MSIKKRTEYIITGAIIAALYAGLTYLSNIFALAYGNIQFRLSELLTILPLFTPAAIPGLTIGCFIANIGSFNVADLLFGSFATLLAALLTYNVRGVCIKNIPLFSMLSPVLINALIIGAEISIFLLPERAGLWGFVISAIEVGISELIICVGLGIPFFSVVKKYKIFEKGFYKTKR